MSQKNPLATVTEKFGGKDKLVDQIVSLIGSTTDEPKDELRKRLLGAANSKLLRLHETASTVKDKFGSKDKLIKATVDALKRGKDKDYVAKVSTFSTGRLLDIARVAEKRAKAAAQKTKAA